MRTFALVAALLSSTAPAFALERTSVPLEGRVDLANWSAGASCTVTYFNACTGWVWIWDGWSHTERVGMAINTCCPEGASAFLTTANFYAWRGVPSGYGFTGTASIYSVDSGGCLGTLLGKQPPLPATGDNITTWFLPAHGRSIAMVYEHAGPRYPDPTTWVSDHPAEGPTGPPACGTCYPSARSGDSYLFGLVGSPLCPGSNLNDGVCDAEWLWTATFLCADGGVAVQPETWSAIKAMYR